MGEDKKPVVATVTVTGRGLSGVRLSVVSGRDGSFSVAVPLAGSYQFCVAAQDYLDPCLWSPISPSVDVPSDQMVTGYKLVLKKATSLTVKLNDSQQVLRTVATAGKIAPHLVVGVFTERGLFLPLNIVARDTQGSTLSGPIPVDKSVRLHLVGRDVNVTDSTGAKVDINGWNIPVTVSSAAVLNGLPAPLVFTVIPNKP